MTNEMSKKRLTTRDLITTEILAALYVVCAFIGELIFGFFPVLTFLCPLCAEIGRASCRERV